MNVLNSILVIRKNFPTMNYFDDIDKAYENFILKVVTVINIWLQVKTNALKVDGNTGLMLKSWKNNRGTSYSKKKKIFPACP